MRLRQYMCRSSLHERTGRREVGRTKQSTHSRPVGVLRAISSSSSMLATSVVPANKYCFSKTAAAKLWSPCRNLALPLAMPSHLTCCWYHWMQHRRFPQEHFLSSSGQWQLGRTSRCAFLQGVTQLSAICQGHTTVSDLPFWIAACRVSEYSIVIPVDAWPAGNRSLLSALYQDGQGIFQSMDQTYIGLASAFMWPDHSQASSPEKSDLWSPTSRNPIAWLYLDQYIVSWDLHTAVPGE